MVVQRSVAERRVDSLGAVCRGCTRSDEALGLLRGFGRVHLDASMEVRALAGAGGLYRQQPSRPNAPTGKSGSVRSMIHRKVASTLPWQRLPSFQQQSVTQQPRGLLFGVCRARLRPPCGRSVVALRSAVCLSVRLSRSARSLSCLRAGEA